MAITRTVNYTQNVIASLGFVDVLNQPGGEILTVKFGFDSTTADSKMGSFYFDETAGVTQTYKSYSSDQFRFPQIILTGTTAALNTCLNTGTFKNHYYECENLTQDFLSQNRSLGDYRGELMIQISPDYVHGLSVGSEIRTTANSGRYKVTKIDDVNSPTRIWLMARTETKLDESYFGNRYSVDLIGQYITSVSSTTPLTPILDQAYCNPHGDFTVDMTVFGNTGAEVDSGVITMSGRFFVNEPYFSTLPPTTVAAAVPDGLYTLDMGRIAQADNNYQSVQILFKYCENDPMYLGVASYSLLSGYPTNGTQDAQAQFIGAAIESRAKVGTPAYITSGEVGNLGIVQLGERIATVNMTSGLVRWHFYGTPDECNEALSKVTYYRLQDVTKDFVAETRIVNGKTRIYNTRGK